jgi:intracellular sulfur oxidation DsrE/DsrF family protein
MPREESNMIRMLSLSLLLTLAMPALAGEPGAPWGKGKAEVYDYAPQKVLYDVSAHGLKDFTNVLDRVSYLNNLYGADPFQASIVLVLHGDEIPFFAIENHAKYAELMQRAQSLTLAGPIEFRMCRVAAKGHGYDPEDIHGFVKLVPMADAEIVKLQQEGGYAYMR